MGKQRTDWWTNSDLTLALANELVNEGYLATCNDLLLFFRRPFMWDNEFHYWQQHGTIQGFDGSVSIRRIG